MSKIKTAIELAQKKKDVPPPDLTIPVSVSPARAAEQATHSPNRAPVEVSMRRLSANLEAFRANRILMHDEPHPAEGAYRMLRTRVMRSLRSNGWQILGISSINQDEGKTFTAINLAISIAAELDQYAVLVDLDLRRPSIHSRLGVKLEDFTCLTQYLSGDMPNLGDMLVCPGVDRLGCLLTATPLSRPSDMLASQRGQQFFKDLREQLAPGTIVIVDLPPIYGADDALAVCPMLDGMLLVVAEGLTKQSDLSEAQQLIEDYNVVGTILNMSVERDSRRTDYY